MIFKERSDFFNLKFLNINIFIKINNSMRITHRNCCYLVLLTFYNNSLIHNRCLNNLSGNCLCLTAFIFFKFLRINRNLCCLKNWCAHVNPCRLNPAICTGFKFKYLHTCKCINSNCCLICKSIVIHELSNTSYSIATHLSLRTICVVHLHKEICSI